jgi:putative ATP-binding cassette transporter
MIASLEYRSIPALLWRRSPKLLSAALLCGLLAGLAYSVAIPLLLHGLNVQGAATQAGASDKRFHSYFALCLFILISRSASLILVNNIVKDVTADLRIGLSKRINSLRVSDIEQIGMARLVNMLVDDIGAISTSAISIPMIGVALVTLLGIVGYLLYLDLRVALIVIAAIGCGAFVYKYAMGASEERLKSARALRDDVQEGVRGLIFGASELKLNSQKSAAFIEDAIARPEKEAAKHNKIADAIIHSAGTFGDLLSFLVIGLVAFVVPRFFTISMVTIYGAIIAIFYIIGPLANIMHAIPTLLRGQVSLDRLKALGSYAAEEPQTGVVPANFSTIRLQAVRYDYPNANKAALLPTSLTLRRGEILFIVGGNGSGKSTLSKILSLLYLPPEGTVYFDECPITRNNIAQARDQIGIVLSNYHLFAKLYGAEQGEQAASVQRLLELLELDQHIRFEGTSFSSTQLSDGQRRRLALLLAILDDKEVYVFDEWAADQDPRFKEIFYRHLLQDFKIRNRFIVVITHDDRYFHCADRVVTMEDGAVLSDELPPRSASLAAVRQA